ncbi:uncharacterized protein LOC144770577 [Lissotriton helveticus]
MAPLCLLLVLVCGTVASSISDTEGDGGNDRPSRRHPPPVASFLKSLNALQTRKSEGEPGGILSSHHGAMTHQRENRRVSVPRRGCPLGTCRTHHLANKLKDLVPYPGKENSNTSPGDPNGYGRR